MVLIKYSNQDCHLQNVCNSIANVIEAKNDMFAKRLQRGFKDHYHLQHPL